MSADVAAGDIASALGISVRAVNLRAASEKWLCGAERATRGGRVRLYPVGLLPSDVRGQVLIHLANREAASAGAADASRARLAADATAHTETASRDHGLARFATLPEGRQRVATAKAEIVRRFLDYARAAGQPRHRVLALFVAQYNACILEVPAEVRSAVHRVSARSIEYWEVHLARGGLARLAGNYGAHRKGNGAIDRDKVVRDFILGMLVEHPHVSAGGVMRGIRARFVEQRHPSYRNLQRWIAAWKRDNDQLFTAIKNPDEWRSKFKAAGGDKAASIVRLNQRWEMDGTKGDLRLSDGSRHTITQCIDVYSRRMKLHVSRTASAAAVASCLRRAILDWGVPEQLGTDNGSDFVSRHMKGVVAGLGIEHDIAPPYTPEHKPFVERGFGTFCRDLVELLPGYVGHDVADAQAIRARQSFAQRLMKEGGEKIELRMNPAELQAFCDQWTETVYARDPHTGLGGKTPFQRAAEWTAPIRTISDERALDILLLPPADGHGIRTIGKKGIKLDNAWFEGPELGGREGEDVRVLLDDADIGLIYVFAIDGPFIAKAWCPERAGISRQELAMRRAAHQKDVLREQKAELRAHAKGARIETLVADILAERAGDAAKVVAFPRPSVPHTTPDLDEAALAARKPAYLDAAPASEALLAMEAKIAAELANPETRSPEDDKYVALIEGELAKPNVVPLAETDIDRFKRTLVLTARMAAGETIPYADHQWMRVYSNTAEYKGRLSLYLVFGVAALEQ